jgi:phenylalanyl-tRNA synthetase beta chain
MKFAESWLREWVDPPVATAALCERLTLAGHELESVEPVAPPFDGIVVAAVRDVKPHPNADKLRVCRVDDGRGTELEIVCGAPNVYAGMRAPLARDGASLPGGVKIRRSKLRGVVSEGMLCSARELGLGEDAGGIVELPADAEIGRDLREYLLLDDRTIDLAITANRGDCLGVAGIAREVGALYRLPVRAVEAAPVAPAHDDVVPVRLDAPQACPAYAGRVVHDVRVDAPTPLWMRERLRRAGVRPLQVVVDVTNYVMLELGQPLHAFDHAKIDREIVVRPGRAGERLVLLDGREVELGPELLVIADASGPTALAGIMGGLASAVGPGTRSVFFEAAHFAPLAIAGRARRLGMLTDASFRFERGVDPELPARAIERATQLLVDIAGGAPGAVRVALAEESFPPRPIIWLRHTRIGALLGVDVDADEVVAILNALELSVIEKPGGWLVTPPSFRFDLAIEEDLIEEIGRVYGYERIEERVEHAVLLPKAQPEGRIALSRARAALVDRGYHEAVTYSFVDPDLQRLFAPDVAAPRLANPISAELSVMRTSLLPGLVRALRQNLSRQQARVRLFEAGSKYVGQGDERTEEKVLGGIACGPWAPEQWGLRAAPADFFDLKADVEALLALGGAAADATFEPATDAFLHPGQSARIRLQGRDVGWLGALHPRIVRALDLPARVLSFELDVEHALAARVPRFQAPSPYPAVRRDLAVVVGEEVSAARLCDEARAAAPPHLRELFVFDVYQGQGVESGRKSIALGLIFQEASRTLTDADADSAVAAVRTRLEQAFNARIRD